MEKLNVREYFSNIISFFVFVFWIILPVLLGCFINNYFKWNLFVAITYGLFVGVWLAISIYHIINGINRGVI